MSLHFGFICLTCCFFNLTLILSHIPLSPDFPWEMFSHCFLSRPCTWARHGFILFWFFNRIVANQILRHLSNLFFFPINTCLTQWGAGPVQIPTSLGLMVWACPAYSAYPVSLVDAFSMCFPLSLHLPFIKLELSLFNSPEIEHLISIFLVVLNKFWQMRFKSAIHAYSCSLYYNLLPGT